MILAAQSPFVLSTVLLFFAATVVGGWWWMFRAEWRHRPTEIEVGLVPQATFRVGVRTRMFAWSQPLARVSTYDDFAVVVALGAAPIVLRRSDRVRVHTTRPFAAFGVAVIDLQPARKEPGFLLRIASRPRDALALEAALRRSFEPASGDSG